ncbi:hypothetical protein QKW35_17385 [Pontibacterium granulatum]|uniref:hypothetical protein n=1 Tax=Pontibacterium granulatum TaxID=2036029 RepID=UPI00249A6D53|nr:hypothetical protein [Pontibacterium granulatum]MDI3326156.1 hypothetical protein [Pontibacterium granulatum]
MMYLAMIEELLFWGGLAVFLVSLALYAGRTKDFKSVLMFWQPNIEFNVVEFKVNRAGLSMMIVAVVLRLYAYFMS